jgi:acyl-CoA synthetase (AMP-forming)/AMP-acid ligase II
MNVYGLLTKSAVRHPHKAAVFAGTRQFATYAELDQRARSISQGLRRFATPGERVVIATPNCPEYIEIVFGAWAAGLIVAPVNAKLHPREILQIIEDAEPKAVFASVPISQALAVEGKGGSGLPDIIDIGDSQYLDLISGDSAVPLEVSADSTAWLFFTSGTTGRSKGAMLSHRNLIAMAIAFLADFDCVEADHSLIHAAPMSHGSGLFILPYIARAARHIVPASGGYDAAEFIELCTHHSHCAAFLVPTMVQRLRLAVELSGNAPRNLRTLVYGGGPMYVQELIKALDAFGNILVQLYGQGEAPMTITGLRKSDHLSRDPAVLGSVGWPRSGVEVLVVGATGSPVPIGQIGEIICRGDVVMNGYWKQLAATAATLNGGWLRTGDMGFLDPDGKLTLRDRSKDVIISGGSNIYPREVEEVLLRHVGIMECSVLGRPDPEWGESVAAVVVLRPGCEVTQHELDAHCLRFIARFKRPKIYLFVDALPKSGYGKVLKRELSALLARGCA